MADPLLWPGARSGGGDRLSGLDRVGNPWPLVGRGGQLRALHEAMDQAGCRGAVLVGPPGAGTSRLAAEAASLARTRSWQVIEIFATRAAGSVVLGAFAPVLAFTDGAQPGVDLMCRAKAAMIDLAPNRRLAVVIDDAHLLDDCSAALAHALATSDTAFVVASSTSGDPQPDAVAALAKQGWAPMIEVPPLAPMEIRELLTQVLGGHIEGATVQGLGQVARGLPRLMSELVHAGLASGRLASARGVWRWRGPMLPAPAMVQAVHQRLAVLTTAQRQLLRLVAVAGPLDAELAESVSSPEVLASVDDAGLLHVTDDARGLLVNVADPLHGEILRAAATPLQVRAIRNQLAREASRTTPRGRAQRLRYAVWQLDGGHLLGPEALVAVARDALTAKEASLAERLARAAVDAGSQFGAKLVLAEAMIAQGRAAEGDELLVSIEPLATTSDERARLASCRASNLFHNLRRSADAEAVLRLAEAQIAKNEARDLMVATRASFLLYQGRPSETVELASSITRADGQSAALHAFALVAAAWAISGRTDKALASVERGLASLPVASLDVGGRQIGADLLAAMRWDALWFAGRLAEAEALAHALYFSAVAGQWQEAGALAAMQLGLVARAQGRVVDAMSWLQEAAVGLCDLKSYILPGALAALAQASVLAGDLPRAEAAIADADACRSEHLSDRVRIALSRAWLAWAQGEVAAAIQLARGSAELARDHELSALEAISLHDVIRLGGRRSVASRLRTVATSMDGLLFGEMARHAEAVAAQDGAALLEVSERFAAMGYRLYGAEVAAEATRAQHQAGSPRLAKEAARLGLALAAECQGAQTPALTALRVPAALTQRELEIAKLAAGGLSNRQIAERLDVSVRTVENLLHRAYFKVGVQSRRQLKSRLEITGHQNRIEVFQSEPL